MTTHWKAVEQYFIVVLFVNPLTPRVKPWAIQSSLTFDSMYRTLKCDHWKAVFQFYPVCYSGLGTVEIESANREGTNQWHYG